MKLDVALVEAVDGAARSLGPMRPPICAKALTEQEQVWPRYLIPLRN